MLQWEEREKGDPVKVLDKLQAYVQPKKSSASQAEITQTKYR